MQYYKKHADAGGLEYEHKVPDMHRVRWENGDWTDDSDQMLLIMDSLHDKGNVWLESNNTLTFTGFLDKFLGVFIWKVQILRFQPL